MVHACTTAQAPHIARLVAGMRAAAIETGSIQPNNILHDPRPDVNYARQRAWARELTSHVRGVVGERSVPRTVFYPFSGADLSTAVAVFPDADVYILADFNPFLAINKAVLPTQVRSETNIDYNLCTDMQGEVRKMCREVDGALPIVLGRLHAFLGDVQIEGIEFFIQGAQVVYGQVERIAHGLMTFVQGKNKRSQTLVYLNCPFGNSSTLHDELWKTHAAGVDGLLVRGTVGILQKYSGLEARLVDGIRVRGGVVVSGAYRKGQYEVSEDALVGRSSAVIEGFQLSYVKGMHVTLYGRV